QLLVDAKTVRPIWAAGRLPPCVPFDETRRQLPPAEPASGRPVRGDTPSSDRYPAPRALGTSWPAARGHNDRKPRGFAVATAPPRRHTSASTSAQQRSPTVAQS